MAGTYEQNAAQFQLIIEPNSRRKGPEGYMNVRTNMGVMAEHRAVMTVTLGRSLIGQENVHHINGMRDDNRPDNLELWSVSQPAGQRVSDKLAWARAFLDTYAEITH